MNGFFSYVYRVRYADTDQMGVAYHARYFEWFEAARTELLRARGLPYRRLEAEGLFLPVIEAGCRYRLPVRYDEEITVGVRLTESSRTRLRLQYAVRVEEEPAPRAEGYTLHCFVDREGRPVRLPAVYVPFFRVIPDPV